jgi:hypothetical protein
MTNPLPRKRFQVHLSTAIVMMFVAGGLIWANVRINNGKRLYFGEPTLGGSRIYFYGWPTDGLIGSSIQQQDTVYLYGGISIDLIVAVTILFAVWFLCEWLIRRRASRK